jgi:WD40-like Beta Propeller Repeat
MSARGRGRMWGPCAVRPTGWAVVIAALGALALLGVLGASASAGALNGRISFTSFRDAPASAVGGDIFTIDPDGSGVVKLTEYPWYDAQSDWAPDGKQIAYRRQIAGTSPQRFEVWRIGAEGGDASLVNTAPAPQSSSQPGWFPDGSGMLFRRSGQGLVGSDIWAVRLTDRDHPWKLLDTRLSYWYPALSPDWTRLLVATTTVPPNSAVTPPIPEDRAVELAVGSGPATWTAPFGDPLRRLTDVVGAFDSAGNWSPDGSRIAFESDRDGDMDIYVMDADGNDLAVQLTGTDPAEHAHDEGPAWSPDGRQLVFTSGPDNLHGDIHVMDADGTHVRRLTYTESRDESPDWQPIPFDGDLTPVGDAADEGPGAYSVHVSGAGLSARKALKIAARWATRARDGTAATTLSGFDFTSTETTYGDLVVRGVHRGNRGANGNDKELVFLYRD